MHSWQPSPPTGFARLGPSVARLVLAVLAVAMLAGVAIPLSPIRNRGLRSEPGKPGDVQLYQAVIDRVRAGQGFYAAMGEEMPARRYPSRSVFNWRTPLPHWLVGMLPEDSLGRALLGGAILALAVMALGAVARQQPDAPAQGVGAAALVMFFYMPLAVYPTYVMPSLWAGVFIGLSLCAFGVGRPGWGVALGVVAVLLRELAMPYVLASAAWALWNRRGRELAGWLAGLACWAVFYGCHVLYVRTLISPDALAHHQSWIQLGGAPFLIGTAQVNAVLLELPQWVAGVYLVAAVFGLAGWNTAWGTRVGLSVCAFLVAFAVVGQPFNVYWGFLYGPLLCFGLARFPASLADTWRAARRQAPRAAAPAMGP